MKIQEIYKKYKIMPSLQAHQLRVGGVASIICDNAVDIKIDKTTVAAVGLLHDMGNILKFRLDLFPEFLEPRGLEYWQGVQNEFKEKYGPDEHQATLAIIRELEKSGIKLEIWDGQIVDWQKVYDLVSKIGFSQAKQTFESADFNIKIAAYSDMRVEPHGITSLQNRLIEGSKRFFKNKPGQRRDKFIEEMSNYLLKIEKQIFSQNKLLPININKETVSPEIEKFC